MAVFDRLMGLETEYAIRFHSQTPGSHAYRLELFQALMSQLARRIPTVKAKHFKDGFFLASGGAVWFEETERPSGGGGLIEGSTPECRDPYQLLIAQRAQDRLVSEAAARVNLNGQMRLVKNDRDGFDNVYGAQENYEATVAAGWRLWVWRVGLVMLLPLMLMTWLGFRLLMLAMLFYLVVAGLVFLPFHFLKADSRRLALLLFGRDLVEGRETGSPAPAWFEWVVMLSTRMITGPLALALLLVAQLVAFRSTRRQLVPFLMSRPVIAGSGMVDRNGHFQLADKASAMTCLVAYGGFLRERPVFTIGHFFKALCVEACSSPRDYFDLFRRRQRLQIALGDSNMCEMAELLRIGTTALVLDAIEAGEMPSIGSLRRPIQALRSFVEDPTLERTAELSGRRHLTALEIQRHYLDGCRMFLSKRRQEAPELAFQILRRWEYALDELERMARGEGMPRSLVGSLDWVTKRFLLDEAGGQNASWEQLKKIDIRYHEMSPGGYYQMLRDAGLARSLIEPEKLERAMRTAPSDTPATMRAHYIREFGQGDEPIAVNWKYVFLGRGIFRRRKVVLSRYHGPRVEPVASLPGGIGV